MIYSHSKYDWTKIETIADLMLFDEQYSKLVKTEMKTLIKLVIGGEQRDITHFEPKTAAGSLFSGLMMLNGGEGLLQNGNTLDTLLAQSHQHKLDALHRGNPIHINSFGGWNDVEDFLDDDGEWLPDTKYMRRLLRRFLIEGETNTLIIENDADIDNRLSVKITAYNRQHYGRADMRHNIIFGYDTIGKTDEAKEFIQSLIAKHGKLNLIFETVKLDDSKIEALRAYAPYIASLYTNLRDEAQNALGDLIEIHEL